MTLNLLSTVSRIISQDEMKWQDVFVIVFCVMFFRLQFISSCSLPPIGSMQFSDRIKHVFIWTHVFYPESFGVTNMPHWCFLVPLRPRVHTCEALPPFKFKHEVLNIYCLFMYYNVQLRWNKPLVLYSILYVWSYLIPINHAWHFSHILMLSICKDCDKNCEDCG